MQTVGQGGYLRKGSVGWLVVQSSYDGSEREREEARGRGGGVAAGLQQRAVVVFSPCFLLVLAAVTPKRAL